MPPQVEHNYPQCLMRITAEKLATQLNADLAMVKHALHHLNIIGIVTQPIHSIPHDSNRDPWNPSKSGASAWQANTYFIIENRVMSM